MSGNEVQTTPEISVTKILHKSVEVVGRVTTKPNVKFQVFECSRRSEADAKRTHQEGQDIIKETQGLRIEDNKKRILHMNGRNFELVRPFCPELVRNTQMKDISYCAHI